MSGKTKFLVFLLAFMGTGHVLKKRAMEKWGAEGSYAIITKSRPENVKVGDIHKFYLSLSVPDGDPFPKNLNVPDYVYDIVGDNDRLNYEMMALPFLKLQGKSYQIARLNGEVAKEWTDGWVLVWFGLAGSAVGAGLGAMFVLTLIGRLFGYGGNQD